jgi:hypothetical protein
MSLSIYPSWRYHRLGSAKLVYNPDQEPEGADWATTPFAPPVPEPVLGECCIALKAEAVAGVKKMQAQFDERWKELLAELKAANAELGTTKAELEAAQAELAAITKKKAKA